MHMKAFTKNETIFNQGDDGDIFYIVIAGSVDLYVQNQDYIKHKQSIDILREKRLAVRTAISELEGNDSASAQIRRKALQSDLVDAESAIEKKREDLK